MSSKAAQLSPKTRVLWMLWGCAFILAQPLAAQDDGSQTSAQGAASTPPSDASTPAPGVTEADAEAGAEADDQPVARPRPRRRERIDLTVTVPRNESDALLEQDCEEEADAARIANEIIVCRQLGEATDGSWDKEAFERGYAERTQGRKPVDVAGGGIFTGPATIGGMCLIPPCPPEAALIIDVEALPEAPEGSDADRIARGLPPLGLDDNLDPEEIARRRRALGLETPPVPDQ